MGCSKLCECGNEELVCLKCGAKYRLFRVGEAIEMTDELKITALVVVVVVLGVALLADKLYKWEEHKYDITCYIHPSLSNISENKSVAAIPMTCYAPFLKQKQS